MINKQKLLKKQKFINDFREVTSQDVYKEFTTGNYSDSQESIIPDNFVLLFADYTYEDYSGDAYVLGYNKESKKFFEVHGGHCSCYGLEDQWAEEYFDDFETMKQVLELRFESRSGDGWYYRSANSSKELQEFLEV